FFWFAQTSQWNGCYCFVVGPFFFVDPLGHCGFNEAWCNGVDTDVVWATFCCQAVGQVKGCCFCGVVCATGFTHPQCGDGSHVDDGASTGYLEVTCSSLGAEQGSVDVDVERKVNLLRSDSQGSSLRGDTGVVDL